MPATSTATAPRCVVAQRRWARRRLVHAAPRHEGSWIIAHVELARLNKFLASENKANGSHRPYVHADGTCETTSARRRLRQVSAALTLPRQGNRTPRGAVTR